MNRTLKTILVDTAAVSAALTLGIGIVVAVEPERETLAAQQVADDAPTRQLSNSERGWPRLAGRLDSGQYTVKRVASTDDDYISMEEALQRLREEGYTEIREIEREKGGYEAEVRDADGRRTEVFVDGRNGHIYMESEDRDDDDHKDDPNHD